jgi:hypothetical protein
LRVYLRLVKQQQWIWIKASRRNVMATTMCISYGWVGEDREVELVVKDGCWVTRHYIDGEPDQSFSKTQHTHELLTPWSEAVPRSTVVQELTARNPHLRIR